MPGQYRLKFDAYTIPDRFVVRAFNPCGVQLFDSQTRGFAWAGCAATPECCCPLRSGNPACTFSGAACDYGGSVPCPAGGDSSISPFFTVNAPPGGGLPTIYVTAYGFCGNTNYEFQLLGPGC